jgi:hypothetical protein
VVLTNENGGFTIMQTNAFLFMNLQHVLAHVGHHQVIL